MIRISRYEPEDDGFYFQDVYSFPDPKEPNGFYYVPGSPIPERDPTGLPTLTLWLGGQQSRLQFGVQWTAEATTLQALPAEIVRRYRERKLAAAAIRLMPAQAEIDSVMLAIGNGSGGFTDLLSVRSSGFPPFSALFNVVLDPEQTGRATRAINGSPGCLKVTYRGHIRKPGTGAAPIEPSADLGAWFPDGGANRHIRVLSS